MVPHTELREMARKVDKRENLELLFKLSRFEEPVDIEMNLLEG